MSSNVDPVKFNDLLFLLPQEELKSPPKNTKKIISLIHRQLTADAMSLQDLDQEFKILQDALDINSLFKEAFQEGNGLVCEWLISKGVDHSTLDKLPASSHAQRQIKEGLSETLGHTFTQISLPKEVTGQLFGSPMPRFLELGKLKQLGIDIVVVLTPTDEIMMMGDGVNLIERYQEMGLSVIHSPIEDFSTPNLEDLVKLNEGLDQALASGKKVLVHCAGGRGRTGLVLASYYIKKGLSPEEAIEHVRQQIAGAIETEEQAAFLFSYSKQM